MRTNNLNCCCIWLHLHNVSSNVSAMYLDQIMHNPTGCIICLAFLHCGFSNGLPERMHSHIGCICLVFLRYVFSNVSSNCLHQRMRIHIGCICLTFLHCGFSNVPSNCLHLRMQNHTGCICLALLHLGFSNVSS